jgi:hypothetical protein
VSGGGWTFYFGRYTDNSNLTVASKAYVEPAQHSKIGYQGFFKGSILSPTTNFEVLACQ